MPTFRSIAIVTALTLVIAGCGKKEEPAPPPPPPAPEVKAPEPPPPPPAPEIISVAEVSLGNAIGADKKVTAAMESFGKKDTIYAAVETKGTGEATLKAKWTFHKGDKSKVVAETEQTIRETGPAVSEFHISKPDGWPAGDYQVEVFLGEQSVATKKFAVK